MKTIKEIMYQLPQNLKVSRQVVKAYLEIHKDQLPYLGHLTADEWAGFAEADYIGRFDDAESLNACLLDRAVEYIYNHTPVNIDPTGFGEIDYVGDTLAWNGGDVFIIS